MNIGILSMQKVINFGSVLQAYSLKQMLEECGETNVRFIDIDWKDQIPTHMPISDSEDYASSPYLDVPKFIYFIKKVINKGCEIQNKKKIKFFQKNELKLSDDANLREYDLVIVGSDEVFMAKKSLIPQLYGRIKNTKHIVSYAASCGSAVYEGLPTNRISDIQSYLSNFEKMSVRDQHTMEYIRKMYKEKIEIHLDPVLMGPLYRKKHYRLLSKNYLLVYAYGDRIRTKEEIEAIKTFSREKGLLIVAVGAPQYWADKSLACSPMELLDYFYYADYVVTDTFHGAVFSIITNRKFCVFARNSNKFKLFGLLELLNLKNHVLENSYEIKKVLEQQIDYATVNCFLEKERNRAYMYLRSALELAK